MKYSIYIQSVSDLITNSSSEVFICSIDTKDKEALKSEVESFINDLMETLGYSEHSYYTGATVEIADKDVEDEDYSYKKGDLIIWSKDDNSIPLDIVQILEDLYILPKFEDTITNVERHHLG